MRRLYFLAPDRESAHSIVVDLKAAGLDEKDIHAIASDNMPLEGLPEASLFQKSELIHGLEWGIGIGGSAGMLGGMLAVTFPPAGLVLGGGAVLLTALTGASLGGLITALVAKDVPNHDLRGYERAVREGQFLLLVDVPKEMVESYCELILIHHPEASIGVSHLPVQTLQYLKQAS